MSAAVTAVLTGIGETGSGSGRSAAVRASAVMTGGRAAIRADGGGIHNVHTVHNGISTGSPGDTVVMHDRTGILPPSTVVMMRVGERPKPALRQRTGSASTAVPERTGSALTAVLERTDDVSRAAAAFMANTEPGHVPTAPRLKTGDLQGPATDVLEHVAYGLSADGAAAFAQAKAALDQLLGRGTAVVGQTVGAVGREARRRPVLTVGLMTVGVGAVAASAFGMAPDGPQFRPPPLAAAHTPAPADASGVYSGLAPYEPPAPTGRHRSATVDDQLGEASPPPTGLTAPSGSGVKTSTPVPSGVTTTDLTATGTVGRTASIGFSHPRDGDTLAANARVSGSADLPPHHQVWLLRRHGAGTPYRVVGACPGGWSFTCGPAGLETGGDENFQLTAVVVDPSTARTLRPGQSRALLPANVAHSEIKIKRAS
ncbi:hypothetical protein GCM10009828_042450 [Actinoplanes couchii]